MLAMHYSHNGSIGQDRLLCRVDSHTNKYNQLSSWEHLSQRGFADVLMLVLESVHRASEDLQRHLSIKYLHAHLYTCSLCLFQLQPSIVLLLHDQVLCWGPPVKHFVPNLFKSQTTKTQHMALQPILIIPEKTALLWGHKLLHNKCIKKYILPLWD